jgi:hypothetical protein
MADGSRLNEFDATVSQDPSAIDYQRFALAYAFGCGTIRIYGFGDFQPFG